MSIYPAEYDELSPNGTTIPLELEIEEDVEKEIHHFVKLSRMGNYSTAQKFFDHTLKRHDTLFPVVAEYADMLLEQGRYGQAAEFLGHRVTELQGTLDVHELQLVRLMHSLANIYTKGALRPALVEANKAWELLDGRMKTSEEPPDELQIHIFEVYINIVMLGYRTSDWVTERWMGCPFLETLSPNRIGFVQWYIVLRDRRLLWEASRVLRALLPSMSTLLVSDLPQLLHDCQSQPLHLSVPERWASLMIALHQAHFLLDTTLRIEHMHAQESTEARNVYEKAKSKLDDAHKTWKALPADEGSKPLHLPLALESVCFHLASSELHLGLKGQDTLFTLSNILSEADIRHDLQSQILARLYILLGNDSNSMDWRDLHTIFELQIVDCGSILHYADTWELFMACMLNPKSPVHRMSHPLALGLDRNTLLMYRCTRSVLEKPKWKDLLCARMSFLRPTEWYGSEPLSFNCRSSYPLASDIPVHASSLKRLSLLAFLHHWDNLTPPPESRWITHSRTIELARLVELLNVSGNPRLMTSPYLLPYMRNARLDHGINTVIEYDSMAKNTEVAALEQDLIRAEGDAGPDSLRTLRAARRLGDFYAGHDWWQEAAKLYERALSGFRRGRLWPYDSSVFKTANNLGRVYYIQGRLTEAQETLLEALNGDLTAFGPLGYFRLQTINNLLEVRLERGRLEDINVAEARLLQALRNDRRRLDPQDPYAMRGFIILEKLYRDQGRSEEEIKGIRRADTRSLPERHKNETTGFNARRRLQWFNTYKQSKH